MQQYLESRSGNVELSLIVRDRYITIRGQLRHWIEFIGKGTKLKGLGSADCETTSSIETEYLVAL